MLILRKVDKGFNFTPREEKLLSPRLISLAEHARVASLRCSALLLSLGRECVSKSIDLSEIETIVEEGTFCELPGLRIPDTSGISLGKGDS